MDSRPPWAYLLGPADGDSSLIYACSHTCRYVIPHPRSFLHKYYGFLIHHTRGITWYMVGQFHVLSEERKHGRLNIRRAGMAKHTSLSDSELHANSPVGGEPVQCALPATRAPVSHALGWVSALQCLHSCFSRHTLSPRKPYPDRRLYIYPSLLDLHAQTLTKSLCFVCWSLSLFVAAFGSGGLPGVSAS